LDCFFSRANLESVSPGAFDALASRGQADHDFQTEIPEVERLCSTLVAVAQDGYGFASEKSQIGLPVCI